MFKNYYAKYFLHSWNGYAYSTYWSGSRVYAYYYYYYTCLLLILSFTPCISTPVFSALTIANESQRYDLRVANECLCCRQSMDTCVSRVVVEMATRRQYVGWVRPQHQEVALGESRLQSLARWVRIAGRARHAQCSIAGHRRRCFTNTPFTRWGWLDERSSSTHQAHIKLSSIRPDGTRWLKSRLSPQLITCYDDFHVIGLLSRRVSKFFCAVLRTYG